MKFTVVVLLASAIYFSSSFSVVSAQTKIIENSSIFNLGTFNACHASTIVQLGKQTLMAAWFAGDHEGSSDVAIWASIKTAAGWSKPVNIADGKQTDGKTIACWNPVLFKTADGKLYLHYKVGPNPREWWALYKVSADEGKTWSAAVKLPDGFLGPIKDKPIQLTSGKILYPSSVESVDEKSWTIHLEQTDADLTHWQKITINCDTFQAIQPTILVYPHNRLQLLARSKQNVLVQSWSENGGASWSKVAKTSIPNPNSGVDAATTNSFQQYLVYNPLTAGKNWWEGRSVLKLGTSADGIHWADVFTFENETSGEFSYPAVIYDPAGFLHVTYTDKRKQIKYFKLAAK
ncbi:hypothetical protein A0256_17110 [Mucilaginibacter sp. PAMC 26640]|nr:hypothetical protein A0256_17110 [Mucilaginibacter sp. PAMC 26640]